jgi:hypothetical protein
MIIKRTLNTISLKNEKTNLAADFSLDLNLIMPKALN